MKAPSIQFSCDFPESPSMLTFHTHHQEPPTSILFHPHRLHIHIVVSRDGKQMWALESQVSKDGSQGVQGCALVL
jgi:hypothetical protein